MTCSAVCTIAVRFSRCRYTGKERDAETATANSYDGLDYFGARYDSSNIGRWMSPDWSAKAEPVPYSKLDNPQTLNLYIYITNDPLSGIDQGGHVQCPNNPGQCDDSDAAEKQRSMYMRALGNLISGQGMSLADAKATIKNAISNVINAATDKIADPAATMSTPTPAAPRAPHHEYHQQTGNLSLKIDGYTVRDEGHGYAGHGRGLNNPAYQHIGTSVDPQNAGPLPQGQYTIESPVANHMGNPAMKLSPGPTTDLTGRTDSFWMHADNSSHNYTASEGCIVISDQASRFVIGRSGIKDLEVLP